MAGGRKSVIVVTRPQPGADKTARHLAARGFAPVVCPLTQIVPIDLPVGGWPQTAFDGMAMTSANAARHAPEALVGSMRDKPLFAVGEATAMAARERGFMEVHSADGDVDDLAALIGDRCAAGARLLYLCGRTRTGDLEGKLGGSGMIVTVHEVYETKIVSQITDSICDILAPVSPSAMVFHSAESARALSELASSQDIHVSENTIFFAISERVADTLMQHFANRIVVAANPTEAELLAVIEREL